MPDMMPVIDRWLLAARARIRALVDRVRGGHDLDEELREYFTQSVQRHTSNGLPAEAARLAAQREVGGLQQLRETCLDARRVGAIEWLAQDLRVASRRLMRSPRFAAIAIVTTAIGLAASTAVFSVVYGVVLKPLPFDRPDQLVTVRHDAGLNITGLPMAAPLHDAYRRHSQALQDVGLWSSGTAAVTGVAQPEQVSTLLVTDGTLTQLGVAPAHGRLFSLSDCTDGSPDTALLSYDYWQTRFSGDPSVLGRQLLVNARPREIVGVLPRAFRLLNQQPAIALPLKFAPSQLVLGQFNHRSIARLKPGVTVAQANADLSRVLPIWMRSYPTPPGFSPALLENARIASTLRPLEEEAVGNIARVLWIVLGTVGVVLLIACANVANLLLVRAESRRQELATRVALGAGRARVAREQLLESVVIGVAGDAVGLVLAFGGVRLIRALAHEQLPRLDEVGLDPIVWAVALMLSVGTGLLLGWRRPLGSPLWIARCSITWLVAP